MSVNKETMDETHKYWRCPSCTYRRLHLRHNSAKTRYFADCPKCTFGSVEFGTSEEVYTSVITMNKQKEKEESTMNNSSIIPVELLEQYFRHADWYCPGCSAKATLSFFHQSDKWRAVCGICAWESPSQSTDIKVYDYVLQINNPVSTALRTSTPTAPSGPQVHKVKPTTPDTSHIPNSGMKFDAGKTDLTLLEDFALALDAVAQIGMFGIQKGYRRASWVEVENGIQRYTAAAWRHKLAETKQPIDPESGKLHAAQFAWNALARLELILRAQEQGGKDGSDISKK